MIDVDTDHHMTPASPVETPVQTATLPDAEISNEPFKKEINISCLNTCNIKGNILYVTKLANTSDIIFLQETWLRKDEKLTDELKPIRDTHIIKFKSSMDETYTRGRPFGGLAWIISKKIND